MAGFIRSVVCRVINESEHNLVLSHHALDHGSYDTPPPPGIPPQTSAEWTSSTAGFLTGTEGRASYDIGATGEQLTVYWNNPFVGQNAFTQEYTGPRDYEAHDPMAPPPELRPYDPARADQPDYKYDDDVVVCYVLRPKKKKPEEVEEGEAPPDAPPPADQPVPVTHPPGGAATVVRPALVRYRKLVYLALNEPQATHCELKRLVKNGLPRLGAEPGWMDYLTALAPGSHDHLKRADAAQYYATLPGLTRQDCDALMALESEPDPIKITEPGHVGPCERNYAIRALAQTFAEVNEELRKQAEQATASPPGTKRTGEAPMKRLVLSAHHYPGFCDNRRDVLWGADGITTHARFGRVLTLFGGLKGLRRTFASAMDQVEDLMFSACYTGRQDDWMIVPRLLEVFPNLETVWGYSKQSPSTDSAANAIAAWELASRDANARDTIHTAAKQQNQRLGAGYTAVVWVNDGGFSRLE